MNSLATALAIAISDSAAARATALAALLVWLAIGDVLPGGHRHPRNCQ